MDECKKCAAMCKKYQHGVNNIDGVETALVTASMGMGIGGTGFLCTIIAVPIVFALEFASLACGLHGVAGKFISHHLIVKA